jgi:hypothetical protein
MSQTRTLLRINEAAQALHDAAVWTEAYGLWLERQARRPNDATDPRSRTVTFDDAQKLDDFLTGLRQLAPALAQLAEALSTRPTLQIINGGRS